MGGEKISVFEKDGSISTIWKAKIEEESIENGLDAVVYQTEFSGILTGNLGKSFLNQSQM